MAWIYRWLGTGAVLVALALAWWFPTPSLFQFSVPDWAYEYERQYQASGSSWGAVGLFQETTRQTRPYESLSDFITRQLASRPVIELSAANWQTLALPADTPAGARSYLQGTAVLPRIAAEPWGFVVQRSDRGLQIARYQKLNPIEYVRFEDIPTELLYPLRSQGISLALLAVILLIVIHRLPMDRRLAAASISTAAAGVCLIWVLALALLIWPFLYGIPDSDLSFASILIGIVLFLSLSVGLLILRSQYRMLQNFFRGEGVVAQWQVQPEQWQQTAQELSAELRLRQNAVWAILSVITIGLSGYFAYETGTETAQRVFFGFIIAAAVYRLLLLWGRRRRKQAAFAGAVDVIIGLDGVYYGGELHRWTGPMARFQGAEMQPEPQQGLKISYSSLAALAIGGRFPLFYWQKHTLNIPVPFESQSAALSAADRLCKKHGIAADAGQEQD